MLMVKKFIKSIGKVYEIYLLIRKLKKMKTQLQEYLKLLHDTGWSDLIDSRWEEDVIKIIKDYDSNAKDEDIKEVLKLVIYEG